MDAPVKKFALRYFEGLDTPVALSQFILLKHGEWDQIALREISPMHYIDSPWGAEKFKRDAQAVNLLRKADFLETSFDPLVAARRSFWQAERQCKKTNDRFDPEHIWADLDEVYPAPIKDYLLKARKIVHRILGRVPDQLEPNFGPGATFETGGLRRFWAKHPSVPKALRGTRRGLTLGDKLKISPCVTDDARDVFGHYFWPSAWGRAHLSMDNQLIASTRGNRFTTVAKTARTDRGICVEPGGNVFLQLGVGSFLKGRLKKFGLDLRVNKELHMRLACEGSLNGFTSTVDLSAASDTVARNLVKFFLPDDWYCLLDSLRSRFTRIDFDAEGGDSSTDRWVSLEKFSSMGNGFTFELETIIFSALACAAHSDGLRALGDAVFVFGDDIIVPTDIAQDVISSLRFCGFTPNDRKTFTSGPFRESCGGDYFCGIDVRSYHMKELPNAPTDWISVANGVFRRSCNNDLRNSPGFRARLCALDQLPSDIRRSRGPQELGDIIVHDAPCNWRFVWRDSIRWFRCIRPTFAKVFLGTWGADVHMTLALLGFDPEGVTPRSARCMGYSESEVPFS